MKTFINKLHYKKNYTPAEKCLLVLLIFLSLFYKTVITLRLFLYKHKLLKTFSANAFVISIGNLTTGGTGKTPVTCEIANYINKKLKQNTAIVSRGYGGKLSNKKTNIISDGKKIFYSAEMAGDEPYWLAKNCPNTAVLTGKSRINSARYAIEHFKTKFILLDDGFQHIKLARNLNIVLVDYKKQFGNGLILPAGALREEEKELKRADKFIIVNKNPEDKLSKKQCEALCHKLSEKFGKSCLICKLIPDRIYDIRENTEFIPQKALGFTGIGQPEFFFNSLKNKTELLGEIIFHDHYIYTKIDLENLIAQAQKIGAEALITTEKDAVKILPLLENFDIPIKICALGLKADLDVKELLKDLK